MLLIIIAIALCVGSTLGLITKKLLPGIRDGYIKICAQMKWTWKVSAFLIVFHAIFATAPFASDPFVVDWFHVVFAGLESWACVVLYPVKPRAIS